MPANGAESTCHDPLTADAPTAGGDRARWLSPFRERVRTFVDEADAEVGDLVYEGSLGAVRLSFSEANAIREALAGPGDATATSHGLLLADAVAICLKIAEDVQDYRVAARVDEQLRGTVGSVLEHDLEVGKSVVHDLSEPIDGAFAAELREQAVRLGEIRLAVRQHMALARRALDGQQAVEDTTRTSGAQGSAGVLPDVTSEPATEPPDHLEQSRRRYQQLKVKRRRELFEKMKMRRIRWLLGGLGLAVAIVAVSAASQLLPASEARKVIILTSGDFATVPGISSVLAKPPSLFVTVDSGHWNSLDRRGKAKVVAEVGRRLLEADYNGAVFTGTDGQLVGEWVRGVGSYVYPME